MYVDGVGDRVEWRFRTWVTDFRQLRGAVEEGKDVSLLFVHSLRTNVENRALLNAKELMNLIPHNFYVPKI